MKIGLLTTGFPRFEGDCTGVFLLTMARRLVEHGHTVRVLAPEPRRPGPVPQWPGIEVSWVPYARPRAWQQTFYGSGAPDNVRLQPARWAGAASFSVALSRASGQQLTDCDALVSSWCIPSGWVGSQTAAGRPHLCICHATDIRWLSKMPGGGAIARGIAAGATSMWFLSEALRDVFFETASLDQSLVTAHVGPMPVELPIPLPESRAELRRRLGIEGFTLLCLGRLVPVKGIDQLLHAVAALPEPISVRVAGDGPERRKLQFLAQQLAVNATFEGWVTGERKEALLRACDAIVVPSRPQDGLPTVLFEARARALPIIATEAGAIAEHTRDHADALLVPPNDRAALSQAIRQLRAEHAAGQTLRV
ncbi:MAG: glycosyltransferase family 4 protein [Deltaproteobacteria bacterium]|nr:glycosyltransferase family 4 protein [Deltaproteobacteria bacterium]MBW2378911.1 glycosyltransferase family 4 protein [Deltaproteobacteria bacterium]MBW2626620.1 glycosyltransferase family 4 protein [Deltaproteobacteria bacterium]MBW2685177.1 glycosyltransferase family 4 protein [Deltaproteobacteria bacterium]